MTERSPQNLKKKHIPGHKDDLKQCKKEVEKKIFPYYVLGDIFFPDRFHDIIYFLINLSISHNEAVCETWMHI